MRGSGEWRLQTKTVRSDAYPRLRSRLSYRFILNFNKSKAFTTALSPPRHSVLPSAQGPRVSSLTTTPGPFLNRW